MGERRLCKPEVGGSSPLTSTKNRSAKRRFPVILQLHPRGAVAQSGERNTGSVEVVGSNPIGSTTTLLPSFHFVTAILWPI